MKEKEYILTSNLQCISNMSAILREGVLPGDDYGISHLEKEIIQYTLRQYQIRLFKLTGKKLDE